LFLPHFGEGFWPLVSMGAMLAGTMRSPFTGILFAVELTHDYNMLLPLLFACFLAHGFTTLVLKRSILTEKIARRGYHLSREYSLDPLEILFVREVMRTNVVAFPREATVAEARELIRPERKPRGQHLFPVINRDKHVLGVVSRNHLAKFGEDDRQLGDIVQGTPVVAYSDEPLRAVVYRMAESGYTRMPVMDAQDPGCLAGMISLEDLLRARSRNLNEERERERVLRLRLPLFGGSKNQPSAKLMA
jgi:CBS domain-containing protein